MRLRVLAPLATVALLALGGSASANTYCVRPDPSDTGCPSGSTPVQQVQQGLDLASGNPGPDRVAIRPICAGCKLAGGTYASSDPLEVVGAGRGATTLGLNGQTALSLGAGATVSDLTVAVATGSGTTGLELDGSIATRVDVTVEPAAAGSNAVVLHNGASFRNGRVTVGANATGVAASAGTASMDSVLVKLLAGSAAGLVVESPATQDATLNARHVTVAGTPGSAQDGAAVNATAAGETASLNLRSAIIHGVARSLRRAASAGATAQIAADYSNYDPTGISSSGSGGIASNAVTNLDPRFVGEAGGDYRLAAGSPLIDAGEPDGLTGIESPSDLEGNKRILNGDPDCVPQRDLGAYEFVSPNVFTSVLAPASGLTGQPLTFDGSLSCDPDPAATLGYSWSFDDGAASSGPTVQHAFASPGTHAATLTVTSSSGRSGSAGATVGVALPAPATGSISTPPPFSRKRVRPPVLIATRRIVVSSAGVVAIPLRCEGTERCTGRITLATTRPVAPATHKRIQKLGSARFSIPAGRKTRVKIRLAKAKLRLAKKLRRLSARATVTDRDSAGRTRKVTRAVSLTVR